ncbi:MAG: hypothetical protein HQL90_15385 [Magnetococcales bacterium]|nr:hypothetical protein [Magnetococcales bacterium]
MGYRKPEDVVAPKSRWEPGGVLYNTGQGGWAVSEGFWDKEPALGIRWNGDDDSGSHGSPQSHGNPTWFIVPSELEEAIRDAVNKCKDAKSFIKCSIDTPEDFQYGVFRVMINVEGSLYETIKERKVPFEIPQLPSRLFRSDDGFWTHPASDGGSIRGLLINGTWKGVVQSNGVAEDDNPTEMVVVKETLTDNVLRALKPFVPETHPSHCWVRCV